MNWSDIGTMVGKAAPMVGTLLGGPAGAAVGALVASALNVPNDPNAVNAALSTNPEALVKVHEGTTATLKDVYKGTVQTLASELGSARGKTIGIIGGNHFFATENGETTDHMLASLLRTKFLGVASLIRVNVNCGRYGNTHFDIFAHHGAGGGSTPGATFNTIEKMAAAADADFYFMGHDHKKGCIPSSPRMKLVQTAKGVAMRARTPWLGRTGSFLKCYEPGMVSYNVDAMRPACALGWIEFARTPTIVNENGVDLVELDVRGTS